MADKERRVIFKLIFVTSSWPSSLLSSLRGPKSSFLAKPTRTPVMGMCAGSWEARAGCAGQGPSPGGARAGGNTGGTGYTQQGSCGTHSSWTLQGHVDGYRCPEPGHHPADPTRGLTLPGLGWAGLTRPAHPCSLRGMPLQRPLARRVLAERVWPAVPPASSNCVVAES